MQFNFRTTFWAVYTMYSTSSRRTQTEGLGDNSSIQSPQQILRCTSTLPSVDNTL